MNNLPDSNSISRYPRWRDLLARIGYSQEELYFYRINQEIAEHWAAKAAADRRADREEKNTNGASKD